MEIQRMPAAYPTSTPPPAMRPTTLLPASERSLLNSVSTSLLLINPSGCIAFANHAAETMLGFTTAALADVSFHDLFAEHTEAPLPIPASKLAANPFLDGIRKHGSGTITCNNGLRLPVRIHRRAACLAAGEQIGELVTIEDISDYIQLTEYVELLAHHDMQTGLPKLETLEGKLDAAILQLHASGTSFAVAQIEIDQFRRVTESLGHEAGVEALREIGRRLSSSLEKQDVLTRSGDERFTALFLNCCSQDEALRRASMLLQRFEDPFRIGEYCIRITASVGLTDSPVGSITRAALFSQSELALRRSKGNGGNQVTCFEAGMADWHSVAVQMESQMEAALANREFFMVYQPQVCLQTGRLKGVEALLRWNSPTSGLIMPNTFIPVAEESGFIVQLGEWCMKTACLEAVELQKRLGYEITLAVNVSAKQARAKGFQDSVRQALDASGLKPEHLEVEVTEGLLISHEDDALRVIASLQEIGVSIAMDDFGMGFSNLGYITRFKVDRLKIDRSFVGKCTKELNSKMITTSILFLAKSLGIEVIAEGVETREQAALLSSLQCDMAQGYLYSRPTTMDDICEQAQHFAALVPDPAHAAQVLAASEQPLPFLFPVSPIPAPAAALVVETPSKPVLKALDFTLHSHERGEVHLEPRDPICRPIHPQRLAGAARIRIQTAPEDHDTFFTVKQA